MLKIARSGENILTNICGVITWLSWELQCRRLQRGVAPLSKAWIPLLQVMIDMNKVKKVLGINQVKQLGKKVTVIH